MKYKLLLAAFLLSACAAVPVEQPAPGLDTGTDVSATETAPETVSIRDLVANVVSVTDDGAWIDAGGSDGVAVGDVYLLRESDENIGWVAVVEIRESESHCVPVRGSSLPERPGQVAVRALGSWHPPEQRTSSFGVTSPAPMPHADHPLGTWEAPAKEQITFEAWWPVLCCVVEIDGPAHQTARPARVLWGEWRPGASFVMRRNAQSGEAVLVQSTGGNLYAYHAANFEEDFSAWPDGTLLLGFTYDFQIKADNEPSKSEEESYETRQRGWPPLPKSSPIPDPTAVVFNALSPRRFELQQFLNPVREGQRVEVRSREANLGMATAIRAADGSIIFELDRSEGEGPAVKRGDNIYTPLWRPDRPLRVAVHGSLTETYHSVSREELIDALVKHGCEVHNQAGPKTDLVILGAKLLRDDHYRQARNSLRFDTLRVEEAMRYLER